MMVSVIVLNWNGKELLKECLPSVVDAAAACGKHEVIIVDNGSEDGSVGFLESKFPNVRILRLGLNMGIAPAHNLGAKAAKGDVLVFLNNDIMIEKDSLRKLATHFKDPKVFGVSPKLLKWDKRTIQAEFLGVTFVFGTVVQTQPNMDQPDKNQFKEPRPTFFALGGASAMDRKKFDELGGFDEIYAPFYWEEVDLSYRAWKRGWTCIYEPAAVFYHKHRATLKKAFTTEQLQLLEMKMRFVFTWSNFQDPAILFKHFLFLPAVLARSAFKGKYRAARFIDVRAFLGALRLLPRILRKRSENAKDAKLSDTQAMNLINSNHANEIAPINSAKFFGRG